MKKILYLLIVLSSVAYSQNVTQKKEAVSKLLCKNWIVDHALLGGLKVEKMGELKSLKYSFKTDGTYQMNDKFGKWTFNEKKNSIELFLDGVLKSVITTLDGKKYIMVLSADKKTAPKGLPAFEIYFKPKA